MTTTGVYINNAQIINQQINNILNEIKRYKQHLRQLNKLLDDTVDIYDELKALHHTYNTTDNPIDLFDFNDEMILKNLKRFSVKNKRFSFVICGNSNMAKAIVANHLLQRQIMPVDMKNENWRIIKIKYGKTSSIALQLLDTDFELMNDTSTNHSNSILATNKPLELRSNDLEELSSGHTADDTTIIEIQLNDSKILEFNGGSDIELVLLSRLSNTPHTNTKSIYLDYLSTNIFPIFIYPILTNKLSEEDIIELTALKDLFQIEPVFFIKLPDIDTYLSKHQQQPTTNEIKIEGYLKFIQQIGHHQTQQSFALFKQLCDLGYLNTVLVNQEDLFDEIDKGPKIDSVKMDSELCEKYNQFNQNLNLFLKKKFRLLELKFNKVLLSLHEKNIHKFILRVYDMARDLLITPRKIEYAKEKELRLYESLIELTYIKQDEFKRLIGETVVNTRTLILSCVSDYEFHRVEFLETEIQAFVGNSPTNSSSSSLNSDSLDLLCNNNSSNNNDNSDSSNTGKNSNNKEGTLKYAKDIKQCTQQIQELVVSKLNNAIAEQITSSIEILKENYIGTLKRCLHKLEYIDNENLDMSMSTSVSCSFSTNNSNNYGSKSNKELSSASEALKQILNSAYQLDVTLITSSSLVKILIQRMKELLRNMPWSTTPKIDNEWKIAIATEMLNNLNESKLAKLLCNQMRERLKISHNTFTTSLKLLEAKHNGRLEKTEELQQLIRKQFAPKFARLCLESTSLKDYILYGMPQLGKEIGRGQYGVVYNCPKWSKHTHLAIKSVVPPDDKHWNDLALEYHYTKQISDHEHIVKLLGSVVDYSYGNGVSPAVLLIMEGMKRDLYVALKVGLDWLTRLQIALDVVEGIRYLHGRGLVHRDIKLKNVLLDGNNKAKITDLGFCKPEAMMSGSIVGTPVHMSPEIFNSKYDNTVDIYAFGILFWYICAGHVRLPQNFEQCTSKDDLWSAVKRGKRPEKLATFDDDCWLLMESCWNHVAKDRPHIGEVFTSLSKIFLKYNKY